MDRKSRGQSQRGCPHVNLNDSRCSRHLSLGRLDQAFCVCFGAYHACPTYHQINGDLAATQPATPATALTLLAPDG